MPRTLSRFRGKLSAGSEAAGVKGEVTAVFYLVHCLNDCRRHPVAIKSITESLADLVLPQKRGREGDLPTGADTQSFVLQGPLTAR